MLKFFKPRESGGQLFGEKPESRHQPKRSLMAPWLRTGCVSNLPTKKQGSEFVCLQVVSILAVLRLSLFLSLSRAHAQHFDFRYNNKKVYILTNKYCSLFIIDMQQLYLSNKVGDHSRR